MCRLSSSKVLLTASCKGPIELQKKKKNTFGNCFQMLRMEMKDGHGLKLEKTWPLCSSLKMAPLFKKKGSFATSKIGVFYIFA